MFTAPGYRMYFNRSTHRFEYPHSLSYQLINLKNRLLSPNAGPAIEDTGVCAVQKIGGDHLILGIIQHAF